MCHIPFYCIIADEDFFNLGYSMYVLGENSNFSGNVGVILKNNLIVFNLIRLLVKLFMDWLNKNPSEVKTYLLVVDNSLTSSCVYNDPLYYPAAL